jgi:hypothetical protein
MKKSLLISLAVVAMVAYAGMTFAMNCLPPICDEIFVTKSIPWKGKWKTPDIFPYIGPKCVKPKCGPCYTQPSTPYAVGPVLKNMTVIKSVDVMKDWCKGAAAGVCPIGCGPCAPTLKWAGMWKTSEIIGKADVAVVLPPAYQWCGETGCPTGPIGVKPMPKPCPPADCF